MDATAVFTLIAFVFWPLVVVMQQHLEVAGDGFEARQSMHEAFSYMVDGADAGEVKERVHHHGLMTYLNVFEEKCLLGPDARGAHCSILPFHSRTAVCATRACIMWSSICSLCLDLTGATDLALGTSLARLQTHDGPLEPRARRQVPL